MADVVGARRQLLQATYTPLKASPPPADPGHASGGSGEAVVRRGRAVEKWSFASGLKTRPAELAEVRRRLEARGGSTGGDAGTVQKALHALSAVEAVTGTALSHDVPRSAARFADVEPAALLAVAEVLVEVRRADAATLVQAHAEILAAMTAPAEAPPPGRGTRPPTGWKLARDLVVASHPRDSVYRLDKKVEVGPRAGRGAAAGDARGEREEVAAMLIAPGDDTERPSRRPIPAERRLSVKSVMEWAIANGVRPEAARQTLETAAELSTRSDLVTVEEFAALAPALADRTRRSMIGFQNHVAVEPVGLLHLERLGFTPAAIERGELVHSLPLAPGEEVNVAHKEWSNTSEEFAKIVDDFMEAYSEEGVAEKSELAEAAASQAEHSTGLDASVTATGSYGSVSVTASVGYNVTDSSSTSEEVSRNQSRDITRKASSRTKREHKITFKVTSAAGTEDQAVRRIKNPFADRPSRVDYYQLLRKWRVDLYRYGIRLTYDITVPEPGSDILARVQELQQIRAALEQGFGNADATLPWARFDVTPEQITRANYLAFAAQYNAVVEPPPDEYRWIDRAETHHWPTKDQAHLSQYFLLTVDVDDAYEVVQASRTSELRFWPNEDWSVWIQEVTDFLGKSGGLVMGYRTRYLVAFFIELKLTLRLRQESFQRWRLKAWAALRDAAQARYYEVRQMFKDRLTRLTEELGGEDALTLRKAEREEIMKAVLRWFFGPDFTFVPPGLPAELYTTNGVVVSEDIWSTVLARGEMIKFLHHAIEWENMLYFLYPYFWSHASRWELKRFLDHPDAMHRAFLKAGSARVVLTIRPGFERDFMAVLETGTSEPLPGDHPYVKITEEMENYARTNYPGIPPANPEEAAASDQGRLIGTWYEYTPTSALDIAFDEATPNA